MHRIDPYYTNKFYQYIVGGLLDLSLIRFGWLGSSNQSGLCLLFLSLSSVEYLYVLGLTAQNYAIIFLPNSLI